jgi:uncharacterized membrane protein
MAVYSLEHLTERDAHFKRRLEAFSDIVFGLSLSELALQLGIPATARELINEPLRYFIFFASFAIVCSLWIQHHRMFRTFVPARTTVFLNFVYLAFTVLMPFGMQTLLKFPSSPIGFGIYAICYAATAASICALQLIGLRDCAAKLDDAERLDLFRRIVRSAALCACMLLALALLPIAGVGAAGLSLFLMFPAMFAARHALRRVPSALMGRLGISTK